MEQREKEIRQFISSMDPNSDILNALFNALGEATCRVSEELPKTTVISEDLDDMIIERVLAEKITPPDPVLRASLFGPSTQPNTSSLLEFPFDYSSK
jgi:hypothetical protein